MTDRALDNHLPSNLASPAVRALHGAGMTSLSHLSKLKESDLKKMHGVGPRAIRQLREALEKRGLEFRAED